eukprot:Gb_18852 [translate_table: standard]
MDKISSCLLFNTSISVWILGLPCVFTSHSSWIVEMVAFKAADIWELFFWDVRLIIALNKLQNETEVLEWVLGDDQNLTRGSEWAGISCRTECKVSACEGLKLQEMMIVKSHDRGLVAFCRKGTGTVSASGGTGWAGGGGGRIAIDCYSRQESVKIMVHGLLFVPFLSKSGSCS